MKIQVLPIKMERRNGNFIRAGCKRRVVEEEACESAVSTKMKKMSESASVSRGPRPPPKTPTERMRKMRQRKKQLGAKSASVSQVPRPPPKTSTERTRKWRQRQKQQAEHGDNDCLDQRLIDACATSMKLFKELFLDNEFGVVCSICDRLWFRKDVTRVSLFRSNRDEKLKMLENEFPGENVREFVLCTGCRDAVNNMRIPLLSRSNGFQYPVYPSDLPPLNCITERLISPRLPFKQIRRLRKVYESGNIVGQIMNVPVDVNKMISMLPRNLEDDQATNVNIQRSSLFKSSHLEGYVQKSTVRAWLSYLMNKPLYKQYNVRVNESFFATDVPAIEMSEPVDCAQEKQREVEETPIEGISLEEVSDIDVLIAQQRTMLWSQEKYLALSLKQSKIPPNMLFDKHEEELSFPSIYLGEPRSFKDCVKNSVTPSSMAKSEIRRRDRRGATPDHVLYMAMKIMRIQMMQGMRHLFRNVPETSDVTRKMIEDEEYLERTVEHDMSFLRTIPNSASYWSERKREVFAMLRQLGRPTMFLTLSASEVRWPHLLRLLYKMRHGLDGDPMKMDSLSRAKLVNEDPVTSVLYFDKLVDVLIRILKHKQGAFGKYRVKDYFKRIEFQHRGSPHAHILLWLENDPCEEVNEEMPDTLAMVEELCSVDHMALENPSNQLHKHTFTCFKENTEKCRFGAPFWPMRETRFLIPMSHEDKDRADLKERYDQIHSNLEHREYKSMDEFFEYNEIEDEHEYLRILRAGVGRPILLHKRTLEQKWTNVYNPWIASVLNSNMDLQFILEEYACAAYVVEYENKMNRGISNLHRELLKLKDEYPDKDYSDLLKEVGLQVLSSVEMSSQEAAWYLLGLGMSRSSRDITYIPTVWPEERTKAKKTRKQLDKEDVADNGTNIWHKGLIEKYENRPKELEQLTLAQFVAYYNVDTGKERKFVRVIRYRGYAMTDLVNFKREKVLLHYPFRNETIDILDGHKFLQLYQDHEPTILKRSKEFHSGMDIDEVMRRCAEMREDYEDEERTDERAQAFVENFADFPNASANDDDIKTIHATKLRGIIREKENVISEEEYCRSMRCTNKEQRTLILESIYRYINNGSEPIQIFFTGPAGCGKTFTTKLLMETYNRIAGQHASIYNAYIACASTGKAATAIGGVTVHSAFKTFKAQRGGLQPEQLTSFQLIFRDIAAVLIDEISMMDSDIFHTVNSRLQQITGNYEKPFGGLNIIFCGDLRQLPPVNGTPIYNRYKKRINGEMLWQKLYYYPLIQIMRQSDMQFSMILTKIGNGERLNPEETKAIERRFVGEDDARQLKPFAIHLFLRNDDVSRYNANVLGKNRDTVTFTAIDRYEGYRSNEQLQSMQRKVQKMNVSKTSGLPCELSLLIGAPYMITRNIDVLDGLVNGTIGNLMYIEYDENDPNRSIKYLWFDFGKGMVGQLQKAKWKTYIRSHKSLQSNWVPVAKFTTDISLGPKPLICRRQQFPLREAYALTVHKSQGATYDEIVYEYSKSHQQELVYVALSRVTSLQGLYLTNKDKDHTFHHSKGIVNNKLSSELRRLENHRLPTVTDECEKFLNSATDLTHTTLNVQSLKAHKYDVAQDFLLKTTKIMALSETCMDNNEIIDLEGYRCINQFKRDNEQAGGVALYELNDSKLKARKHTLAKVDAKIDSRILAVEQCGDICAAEACINGRQVLIVAFYISPGTSLQDTKDFFEINLLAYNGSLQLCGYDKLPIIISGDLNLNLQTPDGRDFIDFMERSLNLKLVSDRSKCTTLDGKTSDAVFTRYMDNVYCRNYVNYFSYHQPILSITNESFNSDENKFQIM